MIFINAFWNFLRGPNVMKPPEEFLFLTGVEFNDMECITELLILLRGSGCNLAILALGLARLFLDNGTLSGNLVISFMAAE